MKRETVDVLSIVFHLCMEEKQKIACDNRVGR